MGIEHLARAGARPRTPKTFHERSSQLIWSSRRFRSKRWTVSFLVRSQRDRHYLGREDDDSTTPTTIGRTRRRSQSVGHARWIGGVQFGSKFRGVSHLACRSRWHKSSSTDRGT